MNDLERDLKDLFDTKAHGVDAGMIAPEQVLRRGRRRQVGTVIVGGLGAIAAIAIVSAITVSVLGSGKTDVVPKGPSGPYGDRTAIIERYQVQAPAGWTLLDEWAFSEVIATGSKSCSSSFSSVGAPVGADAGSDSSVAETTSSSGTGSCTTQPARLPAGIPVLQLSTFDPGPTSLACNAFDQLDGQVQPSLPRDGVATFVTMFPEVLDPSEVRTRLVASCLATPDIQAIVQGPSSTWVTLTLSGPDADPAFVAAATEAVRDLGGHDTDAPTPSPVKGIGYVIGSGTTGDERWQITAGAELEGNASAWITAYAPDGSVAGWETQPWRDTGSPIATAIDAGDAAVALGLVPVPDGAATWRTEDGSSTALTQVPFPTTISLLARPRFDGNVVWGEVPSTVGTLLVDGVVEAPTTTPPAPTEIPSSTEGGVTTGSFDAFGRTIDIRVDAEGAVQISGSSTAYIAAENSTAHIDVDGGTLLLTRLDRSAAGSIVTTDAGAAIPGAWMAVPASGADSAGKLWFVPLPGSGSGLLRQSDTLALAITWPTHEQPVAGDVPASGSQSGATSWALRWTADRCPILEVVDSRYADDRGTATAGCVIAWDSSLVPSFVGGVYGGHMATVALVGPDGVTFAPAGGDQPISVQCGTTFNAPGWHGTGVCIATIEVGTSVTLQGQNESGNPIGAPVTLSPEPGRLNTT